MTKVLFVCTGNICRSPLAEVLMRREIERRGLDGVAVASAGTGAWEGAPASEGAYLVAIEHGLDLSAHQATLVTRDLLAEYDLVLTMARHHRVRADELGAGDHTHVLGEYVGLQGPEAEVSDPFGSDLDVYRTTFIQLEDLVHRAADRIEAGRADA